jgi:hypothetical protein
MVAGVQRSRPVGPRFSASICSCHKNTVEVGDEEMGVSYCIAVPSGTLGSGTESTRDGTLRHVKGTVVAAPLSLPLPQRETD